MLFILILVISEGTLQCICVCVCVLGVVDLDDAHLVGCESSM